MPLENYLTDAASLLEAASSCSMVVMVVSPLFLQHSVYKDIIAVVYVYDNIE